MQSKKLSHYFKTYRKRYGLGQKQMAKLLGKTNFYVSRLERGTQNISLETVMIYLILFEVTLADLIPEEYHKTRTLLAQRINDCPNFFSDKNDRNTIKRRLGILDTTNTKDYE